MRDIIEKAFSFPGAILIRDDLRRFLDPDDISFELGIQQPRQHRRFVSFFGRAGELKMYVKHDPAMVAELYEQLPGVTPSDLMPDHWSKVRLDGGVPAEVAGELLRCSYDLVRASLAGRGQQLVEELAGSVNRFLAFHRPAVSLARLEEEVSLQYTDSLEPTVLVSITPIARFSFNRLLLYDHRRQDWWQLGPGQHREWAAAMSSTVDSHLDLGA